jgi:hypothetical protein
MTQLRKMALAVTTSVALMGATAQAEEIRLDGYVDGLQELLKDVLRINIRAKVLSSREQLVWEARKEAYTVPGIEVKVRIPSESIEVLAYITPERLDGDRILLRVHAEIWPTNAARGPAVRARYSTTVNYIPAELGDKIRFFPLGEFPDPPATPAEGESLYNLELEIQIVPYPSKE